MADEKQPPLTEKEVATKAKKLETLAATFLDKNETDAFDKWHTELRQVAKHGVPSTRQVFKLIEKDSGKLDLSQSKVTATENGNTAGITIQSNRLFRMFDNKQYVGSIVDPDEVFSVGRTRNGKQLAEFSIQRNIASGLMEKQFNALDLFTPKPSALDLLAPVQPKRTNPFELQLPKR